jgi:SOS-response transcriptional repressor LexA
VQEKTEDNLVFLNRVEKLRFENDWTVKQVCGAIGISPVMLHHIRHGTNSVTQKTWFKLTKVERGVERERTASAPMMLKDEERIAPRYNAGPYYGMGKGAPIIAMASAGELHRWEDMGHDVPIIPTLCRDENCYAVEITGDSMEPVYHAGDVAIVMPNS